MFSTFLRKSAPVLAAGLLLTGGAGVAQAVAPASDGTECTSVGIDKLDFLPFPRLDDTVTASDETVNCSTQAQSFILIEHIDVLDPNGAVKDACPTLEDARIVDLDPGETFTRDFGYPVFAKCPGGEVRATVRVQLHGVVVATRSTSLKDTVFPTA
ncbi:hypothetical protein [Actinacidiphila bryophytorum]|uniref:hypothetical protein n=1 Tax=Actinacidiphila bryophytorum TaxID=1436133 RepID=UPI002176B83B|nr:hypothetical protein [Actinacidiphila bryophytorum]UWE10320.1 hypothetical protein NYE86_17415 [Actinacidiphila bryophytorum]